jgi:hypothetical protein
MSRMLAVALLTLACGAPSLAAAQAQSQGLPTSQPSLITIIREEVNVGSYVSQARASDPAFWGAMPVAKRATTPAGQP